MQLVLCIDLISFGCIGYHVLGLWFALDSFENGSYNKYICKTYKTDHPTIIKPLSITELLSNEPLNIESVLSKK